MIPKTIHYCWFGRNPKPKLALKCIKSWKKKCPDYEIIEWNEDNFDISKAPLYVRQAYEEKKWAFVTDYVRLWAMVNFGGIYMDTDVEAKKSFDGFLKHRAFSGFEDEVNVSTGIMACEKNFPLFREFLNYYDDASFYDSNGNITYVTNVEIITDICVKKGLLRNNTLQNIEGFVLYPKDVFCPVSYHTLKLERTKETVTIHWFAGSWKTEAQRNAHKNYTDEIKRRDRIDAFVHMPNRIVKRILGEAKYNEMKEKLKRKS